MNKSTWKKTITCLVVILVLSISVLPLMVNAEDPMENNGKWKYEAPDFTNYYTFNEKDFGLQVVEDLASGIEYAYDGGMFGGAIPIAIMATKDTNGSFIEIVAITQQTTSQNANESKEETRDATVCKIRRGLSEAFSTISFEIDTTQYPGKKWVKYRMCENGDFTPIQISDTIVFSFSDNYIAYTSKILAISTGFYANEYNENTSNMPTEEYNSFWHTGRNWYVSRGTVGVKSEINYFFMTAWTQNTPSTMTQWASQLKIKYAYNGASYQDGYLDGKHDGYDEGYYAGYDIGYEDGIEAEDPVILDIASIFTSMFQGVHSIFQGFNINIFGISIAGMLLGILLIVIIAFIIKKIK